MDNPKIIQVTQAWKCGATKLVVFFVMASDSFSDDKARACRASRCPSAAART